ncbi:MAG: hypothetical protein Q9220_007365 [cf. Caloplaca sp. 1 TL-2023]
MRDAESTNSLNDSMGKAINTTDRYNYERALDHNHFRLLTLDPGDDEELVQCYLEMLSVPQAKDEHDYEAMSYAWGSTEAMADVLCNGRKLHITQDLKTALKHLRHETSTRRLWIDQICVDQESPDERSAQVSLMSNIFRCADRVVVWLGEESDTSDIAIRFAHELSEGLAGFNQALSFESFGTAVGPSNYYLPAMDAPEWTALSELSSRRWFERLWVAQEAVLNTNVMVQCGTTHFPWAVIEKLAVQFDLQEALNNLLHRFKESHGFRFITKLYLLKASRATTETPLEKLVATFASQEASDSRDYIYAMLSLADQVDAGHIIPDYRKSTREVYTDFAIALLEKLNRKRILNLAQLSASSSINTPSWVPDWTTRPMDGKSKPKRMFEDIFSASKPATESWVFLNKRTLQVKGRLIDVLDDEGIPYLSYGSTYVLDNFTKGEMQSSYDLFQFFKAARQLATQCVYSKSYGADKAFCLTCCRETKVSEENNAQAYTVEAAHKAMFDMYELLRLSAEYWAIVLADGKGSWIYQNWHKETWPVTFWSLWHAPRSYMGLRRMADPTLLLEKYCAWYPAQLEGNAIHKTRRGLLANVPKQRKIGDVVAILYGWETPFLLRPVQDGYLLVGECYVHGIMHGEVIEGGYGEELDFKLV